MHQAEPGRVVFNAPRVAWPTTFWVEVQDLRHPDDPARIRIQVLPPIPGLAGEESSLFEKLMPAVMGEDWLAPAPQATMLVGSFVHQPGHAKDFRGINCITYVEPDPRMGSLSGKWLIGDQDGIKAVSAQGEVTPLAQVEGKVTAIAVRPPGRGPRIVYAAQSPGLLKRSAVFRLGPATGSELLAGSRVQVPLAASLDSGRGEKVHFGAVHALACDPDGGVRVLDTDGSRHLHRRIAPDGEVTMLGKLPNPGLAWDTDGRPLMVLENMVFKANPGGKPAHVLGGPGPNFGPPPPYNCLHAPGGLQVIGSLLFIADTGNNMLKLFNLQTRRLLGLAGDPSERQPRPGPLAYGSPARPAAAGAALGNPRVFHINAAGGCLVAQEDALMFLDLSEFAAEPPAESAAALAWEASAAAASSSSSSSSASSASSSSSSSSSSSPSSSSSSSGSNHKRRNDGQDPEPRTDRTQPAPN